MSEEKQTSPKVFISYSWAVQERTKELADRLIENGVNVVIDIYDLQSGHDKYAFMEQQVTDPSIDHVLIICDKTYAEKANTRTGGVGDETTIITPELYGKDKKRQTKFIPVIFENDESGVPCCPAYLRNRIYIDFSDLNRYEERYEELLRTIYKKPIHRKPEPGVMPQWLNNESIDLSSIRRVVKHLLSSSWSISRNNNVIIQEVTDCFVNAAEQYKFSEQDNIVLALPAMIEQTLPLRNLFVDACNAFISKGLSIDKFLVPFFEAFYNRLHDDSSDYVQRAARIELFDFLSWELFIDATALLIHYECFKELHEILVCSYYLVMSPNSSQYEYDNYTGFCCYCKYLEEYCKQKSSNPNLFTYAGDILVKREYNPFFTVESLANADIVLFQLSKILIFCDSNHILNYWFPHCYVYHSSIKKQDIWKKMQSKRYCLKIAPLFGVSSVNEIKEKVKGMETKYDVKYPGSFESAPGILSNIRFEEIGTLP